MNLGPPPVRAGERRAGTALDQLSRRHDHVCTTAVDAWQIAAVLESDGITDRVAAQRYGFSDVFQLADALYRRVPLRLDPEPIPPVEEEGRTNWEVARGALFLLAGLMYPVAYRFDDLGPITLGLALGLAIGWALSNGVAHVVYQRLGAGSRAHAGHALLFGMLGPVSVLIIGGATAVRWFSAPPAVLIAAASLVTFQLGASALLLLQAERWLAIAMVPGVLLNGLHLASSGRVVGLAAALGATELTVILTLSTAVFLAARLGRKDAAHAAVPPDWSGALASSVYGGLTAILLTVDALFLAQRSDLQLVTAFGASVIPLVLSTGAMQPLLRHLHNEARAVLATTPNRQAFTRRVWRSLVHSVGHYAALTASISLASLPGLLYATHNVAHIPTLLVAQVLLGTAMYISLTVVSTGRIVPALAALAMVVTLHLADISGRWQFLPPHDVVQGYLAACALYLLLTIPILLGTATRAEAFR